MTNTRILQGLVAEGIKMRYGDKPGKVATLRWLWEIKQIIDHGFVDYYLRVFWLFHQYAYSNKIGYWACGATPSSIVCYALGLTKVDPLYYGLHSVRFVNDKRPKFQFDIESSRYNEFKEGIVKYLEVKASPAISANIQASLYENITPMNYLTRRKERSVPRNLDDEIAEYALTFPGKDSLFNEYNLRKDGKEWAQTGIAPLDEILTPTYGLLVYQEQMLDILRLFFNYSALERNNIRLAIHRGETKQIAAYKAKHYEKPHILSANEYEVVWDVLISNPKAFLKAHAVSWVISRYYFNKEY